MLTRPADNRERHNNIEFVDCAHLVIRGLRFQGGSSGVRFIRGHHVTLEGCEIFETGDDALTMNSGDGHAFVIRSNHIHHTGLSVRGPTEGMHIGCHDGRCCTTDSLFEGNYIHHTRSTSDGGNDGIEIKFGSHGNVVRNNVIHDTNLGRQYPGIFVYGGGPGRNVVEGNVIWQAGEGIQVVSDAVVRNNIGGVIALAEYWMSRQLPRRSGVRRGQVQPRRACAVLLSSVAGVQGSRMGVTVVG